MDHLFIEELKERGVATSVHWLPLHMQPYYRETYGYQPADFGVAAEVGTRTLILARGAVAHDGPGESEPAALAETYARATTAPRALLASAAAAA